MVQAMEQRASSIASVHQRLEIEPVKEQVAKLKVRMMADRSREDKGLQSPDCSKAPSQGGGQDLPRPAAGTFNVKAQLVADGRARRAALKRAAFLEREHKQAHHEAEPVGSQLMPFSPTQLYAPPASEDPAKILETKDWSELDAHMKLAYYRYTYQLRRPAAPRVG